MNYMCNFMCLREMSIMWKTDRKEYVCFLDSIVLKVRIQNHWEMFRLRENNLTQSTLNYPNGALHDTSIIISHLSTLGVLSTAKYMFVYARVDITM